MVVVKMSPSSLPPLRPDKASATPVYLQVVRGLEALIEGRAWPEGSALPGERDLAGQLGVSRVTVRQALGLLEARGLITRRQGSGTYVAPQRIEQPLSALTGFSEDMRARGLTPGGRVLDFSVTRPTPEEAMQLALSPLLEVARLRRLRTADGEPLAIETSSVPMSVLGDVTAADLENASLYGLLRARGFAPTRAMQHLRAREAGAETAGLLGLAAGAAVLFTERVTWGAGGEVLEYARSLYRGDRYDFVVALRH